MGNSLRDQLLKAGLVDEQKLKQIEREKHKQARQRRSGGAAANAGKRQADRVLAAKAARDRELNRQRAAQAERKAVEAQVRQLIETHRLPKNDGDIVYNFLDGTKVRRLYVTAATHQQLVHGKLAVTKLNGRYDIVPKEVADKIRQRDAAYVVKRPQQEPQPPDENDPYADYQVPDDLMW